MVCDTANLEENFGHTNIRSLGMILFPLGSPIFASLGSAGISIFYVSTIIAQLTFSAGSIFRGGVGSELVCLRTHILERNDITDIYLD